MHYALYTTATGQLVSLSTVLPDPVPAELSVLARETAPADSEMWDAASRSWVARPVKVRIDRLDDLQADTDFLQVWGSLNAAQRNRLRTVVIRLLGRHRYRNASETLEVA